MAPPAPLDEPPVTMPMDPLLPFVETPLLIEIDPLTPDVPASALRIDIVPELAYPDPLTMLTLPPAAPTVVASDDDPEAKYSWPPEPLADDPTVTYKSPAWPEEEVPVPR